MTIDLIRPGSQQTQNKIAVPAQFYGQMLNQLGQIDQECIIAHNLLFCHLGDKVLPFFYMNGAWRYNDREIVVVCRMVDRPPIGIPREHETEPGFAPQMRLHGLWPDMAMDELYYEHLSVAFEQLLLQNIDYQRQLVSDKPVSNIYNNKAMVRHPTQSCLFQFEIDSHENLRMSYYIGLDPREAKIEIRARGREKSSIFEIPMTALDVVHTKDLSDTFLTRESARSFDRPIRASSVITGQRTDFQVTTVYIEPKRWIQLDFCRIGRGG